MKKVNSILLVLILFFSLVFILTGCESNPITGIIISNEQYTNQADIEKTTQPTKLVKDKDIYASVYFIESPKGIKYTAKWFLNSEEIKTDEKELTTDKKGAIVYSLETDKLKEGTLKLQIIYKDDVLMEKEIPIK